MAILVKRKLSRRSSVGFVAFQNMAAKRMFERLMPAPHRIKKVFLGNYQDDWNEHKERNLPRVSATSVWRNEKIVSESEDT